MLKKILKIGDRIELKSIQQSKLAGKDPKTYQSQILDINQATSSIKSVLHAIE